MAIVKMKKLSVIGMNNEKESLLRSMMDLGAVEIKSGADKLQDADWRALVEKDSDGAASSEYDRKAQNAETALQVLRQYGGVKGGGLFSTRRIITAGQKKELDDRLDTFEKETGEILTLQERMQDAFIRENLANSTVASLTPWAAYDVPLELKETKRVAVKLGVLPPIADITKTIADELTDAGCDFELTELGADKEQTYVSLIYMKDDEEKVQEVIKSHGYSNAGIENLRGTVGENITAAQGELAEIATQKQTIEKEIADRAGYKDDIEYYHDMMNVEKDRRAVTNQLLKTKETFTFDGWVPQDKEEKLSELLEGFTCWYEFEEAGDDEEAPVKMKNNSFVTPMEFITKMYSLPSYREVDPTAIFTLFYIIFFGIMFADIGYGIILFLITSFAIKKYHLNEGGVSELMRVLCYCGVSSAFWGLMFGSFFGDLITVVGKTFFHTDGWGIKALWMNPVDSAMDLLVFSCALGVIHLFVGMGIDAYRKIKDGAFMDAVNDDFVWYVIVIGLVMWLFGGSVNAALPGIGKILALAGFAAAIIIPIIIAKGAGKALGIWNIYGGVTGNLSDILSYSRLLGLGLASASIAQVFNFLAQMVGGNKGVIGAILFVVVAVIGHVFNFAINALGSFVHSARLQYVEFFGKFFDGGGEPFRPFERDTKYVRIIEED